MSASILCSAARVVAAFAPLPFLEPQTRHRLRSETGWKSLQQVGGLVKGHVPAIAAIQVRSWNFDPVVVVASVIHELQSSTSLIQHTQEVFVADQATEEIRVRYPPAPSGSACGKEPLPPRRRSSRRLDTQTLRRDQKRLFRPGVRWVRAQVRARPGPCCPQNTGESDPHKNDNGEKDEDSHSAYTSTHSLSAERCDERRHRLSRREGQRLSIRYLMLTKALCRPLDRVVGR